jgi:mono/diheme cytochrome c family protein
MKKIWLVLAGMLVGGGLLINGCGSPTAAATKRGEVIYAKTCLACHQADGTGVSGLNPPLKSSAYVAGEPAKLIGIVTGGLNTGVEINGDMYTNPMPAFGSSLTDNEIADVLTYIRNHFDNKAASISPDQVKAGRK